MDSALDDEIDERDSSIEENCTTGSLGCLMIIYVTSESIISAALGKIDNWCGNEFSSIASLALVRRDENITTEGISRQQKSCLLALRFASFLRATFYPFYSFMLTKTLATSHLVSLTSTKESRNWIFLCAAFLDPNPEPLERSCVVGMEELDRVLFNFQHRTFFTSTRVSII